MPIFFEKNELSTEQLMRWDAAMDLYNRLIADNHVRLGTIPMGQPGHPKSALFHRLLTGKQPLPNPPPLDFSYPWYDVIEGQGPWDVLSHGNSNTIDAFRPDGTSNTVVINQHPWLLLEMLSDTEAIVSHTYWRDAGYRWRLSLDTLAATESQGFIICRHKPEGGRITTLKDLQNEYLFLAQRNILAIQAALTAGEQPEPEPSVEFLMQALRPTGALTEHEKKQEALLCRGRYLLSARLKAGLPAIPSNAEVAQEVTDRVARTLAGHYSVDADGNLLALVWRLSVISKGTA